MAQCQACKKRKAIYAAQFISEDVPTFSLLGSHYRGFKVIKVCEVCKDINIEGILAVADREHEILSDNPTPTCVCCGSFSSDGYCDSSDDGEHHMDRE